MVVRVASSRRARLIAFGVSVLAIFFLIDPDKAREYHSGRCAKDKHAFYFGDRRFRVSRQPFV